MISEAETIPFNRPFMVGTEFAYIRETHEKLHLSGDGTFTARCHRWLEDRIGCGTALLTHSCTAALEMAALLIDIRPGDEVIMPSYTFVSTANAFVLRGGVPVFVDVRRDTLNLDESLIEQAITPRTKAIVPVHYAGVPCDMRAILDIAERHGLFVIEDAAQALMSTYRGEPAGGMGHLAAVSFHETKNISSGEGGAILINDAHFAERARFIREKGTDRSDFLAGRIDKYTWVDLGSSYLPSEITAAFLWAQMEAANAITSRRLDMWARYHGELHDLDVEDALRRPLIPDDCQGNAHMYHVLLPSEQSREECIGSLAECGIGSVSHYVPLHSSPAGKRLGRASGDLPVTRDISRRVLRLPLWVGLEEEQHRVIDALHTILGR
ncbi:dTDP-4-amino-4,6-dideoxygalactose transaminase [uncultured Sphingomonas sp.]|uniref:dTDP-4-amino-4,6-dideoxygalactose transaminase n=1 Tax=uncultured Sphingomonas sp. TaxID=158754 RepID=UPI0035CA2640